MDDAEAKRSMRDVYRAEPTEGERAYPIGPISTHDVGPYAPCAIGFCPWCAANARRTVAVRGLFDCPECTYYWYDERVGEQTRKIEDYFQPA